jgi:hypothetical protein
VEDFSAALCACSAQLCVIKKMQLFSPLKRLFATDFTNYHRLIQIFDSLFMENWAGFTRKSIAFLSSGGFSGIKTKRLFLPKSTIKTITVTSKAKMSISFPQGQ